MIQNLQALRALAAWMVVAHHLRSPLGEIWSPLGDTLIFASGVDIFFVLSGYLMGASTMGREILPMAFLKRRLVRIAPLYWLITSLIVAALLAGLHPVGISSWEWRDIAASYLFLGVGRSDSYPDPLLGVGWTLAYEAFFYVIFGLALLSRARATAIAGGFIVVCVLLGAFAKPVSFIGQFYSAPILLEFALGAVLAHLSLKRWGGLMLSVGVAGLAFGSVVLSTLAPLGDLITPGGDGAIWRTIYFGVPAALIVSGAFALERSGVVCRNQFVLDQGDASYALYLIHLPMIQIIGKAAGSGAALLLIAPPVLAMAAHLTHQGWERPVLTILRPRRFDLRTYRLGAYRLAG